MNELKLHHLWRQFHKLKPWYFLAIALLSLVVCVSALRANNEHMARLREAVYSADKNDTNVQGALRELQRYVTSHMNTNLSGNSGVYPPIQLKYTYDRLVAAQNLPPTNSQLYTDAQHYCEQQDSTDFSGHNRVPCIEQYVQSHSSTTAPANKVPDALYKFAFASPRWSPDLAGWSLFLTIVFGLLFISSWVVRKWIHHRLA